MCAALIVQRDRNADRRNDRKAADVGGIFRVVFTAGLAGFVQVSSDIVGDVTYILGLLEL
jgi:hypothetical protein